MAPARVWQRCGGALLLVLVFGLCVMAAAEAAPSGPPICVAVKGEELSASKAAVPVPLAAVVVADSIVREPRPPETLLSEPFRPRLSSNLEGYLAPRAPPVRL